MPFIRICVYLAVAFLAGAPAFAKNETLAERGKRMCEESGIPLEDCTALPPALRGAGQGADIAAATPAPKPLGIDNPGPAAFGTGKYGWCDDCTSLLAAAPVTPWSDFSGRQFRSQRDEDERQTASLDDTSSGSDPTDGDGNGSGGGNDGGDNGNGSGEICD